MFSEFDKYQISVNVKRPSQQSSMNQLASHRIIGDQTQQTTTPITLTRSRDGDGSNSVGSTQWCDVYDTQLLQPGRTYQVLVKTVSGKVASWPASVNVTLSKYIFLCLYQIQIIPKLIVLHQYFILTF